MYNFNFHNPTNIHFGKDKHEELKKMIPESARILITYGGGSVRKYGLLDKIKLQLQGRIVFEFGGIEPNPRYSTLVDALKIVRNEGIDFLLAVGGGSVIDGTKFISLAANYEGDTLDLLIPGFSRKMSSAIPFATVLTLPATGSEMNSGAVISNNKGKYVVSNKLLYPQFSILDPMITFTLPKKQVANGIVDAFVHVCEQYITFPVEARVQDRISEGILQTLIEIGADNIADVNNYDARANLMWSATMALNGLIGVGVPQDWTTHMIGHQITALFGIDHAQTLAVILPAVLSIRKDRKREKLLQYAERVWLIDCSNDDEKIDLAIKKTVDFFESLGLRTRLSNYGIDYNGVVSVLECLENEGYTMLSETKDLTIDVTRKILEAAL